MILYRKAQNGMLVPVPKPQSSEIGEHSARLDYTMPYDMRQRKDTPAEIAAQRKARIDASIQARKSKWTSTNWREKMAAETDAIGDKLSLQELPVVGKYIPGVLDVTGGIGHMASALGSAPLRSKQSNSLMPYATAVGMPLVAGAIGGIGTKGTGQFVNNMVNPLAGTGDILKSMSSKINSKLKGRAGTAVREAELASPPEMFTLDTGASARGWGSEEVAPEAFQGSLKERVAHVRGSIPEGSLTGDMRYRYPNRMRSELSELNSGLYSDAVLNKMSAEELERVYETAFPDSIRSWTMAGGDALNHANSIGRSMNGNYLYSAARRNGHSVNNAKEYVARTTGFANDNVAAYLPPTRSTVVKSVLPDTDAIIPSSLRNIEKDHVVAQIAESRATGAFNIKSLYQNTKNDLIGDSLHHTFLNISPKEVAENIDGIMNSIPKGGRFSESSLSSDSFRLLTPKLGASKDYKLINTGKLQPLNRYGRKGQELSAKYGESVGAQKTVDLMNSYIIRLERNTGKKITRAKVIDGMPYVPQLIAQKRGGGISAMVNRSKNQIRAGATVVGAGAVGTLSTIGAKALKRDYIDRK